MAGEDRHVHVVGISGSLRRGSYNTALLRAAGRLMPPDMSLEIVTVGDFPLYNADEEAASGFSPTVRRVRRQVGNAAALLVATPEYNFSISGVLKNAIDWLSRPPDSPISLKPTAILGAGGRLGTTRAQEHFRDVALHNDLRMVAKPEVLIADAWKKFDAEGNLVDERSIDQVRRLVLALRGLTLRIRATRKRVLVMARDPGGLRRLTEQLRELGYEPVGALTDEEGLDQLNPGAFAALIIDAGVEDDSRTVLIHHIDEHTPQTAIAQVEDPDTLLETLERSLDRSGPL